MVRARRQVSAGDGTVSRDDREAIRAYREKHGTGPFLAADAVVVSSDEKVLLVRRSCAPQKGRWAFPGGFVEPDETFLQAACRELAEETGLVATRLSAGEALPPAHLVRDEPDRDPRARIVSVAYLFTTTCAAGALPVRGADDAADARWLDLRGALKPDEFYADHFFILRDFGMLNERAPHRPS